RKVNMASSSSEKRVRDQVIRRNPGAQTRRPGAGGRRQGYVMPYLTGPVISRMGSVFTGLGGIQLLPPLGGLVLLLGRLVQRDQTLQGLGQANLARWRNLGRALLQPRVAGQEQWLGVGVLLLAQQRAAQHRLSVERVPGVGLRLFAEGEALA